jgi:ribA/ribD-fused uncharacterized protein
MVGVIDSFRGNYDFLSNFYMPAEVRLDFAPVAVAEEREYQKKFRSVEHGYQAAKFFDIEIRDTIRSCKQPGLAKKIAKGHKHLWRLDWEFVKVSIMQELLRQKFGQEPLRSWLIATGDASLAEGNWWGDTFWGICKGYGDNMLGQLLMQLRETLK